MWLDLPDISPQIILVVAFCILAIISLTLWRLYSKAAYLKGVLVDSTNIRKQGLIIFSAKNRFLMANAQAELYFDFLKNADARHYTLPDFLDYVYDHAVEPDESLRSVLEKSVHTQQLTGFREIVNWGQDKYCLVEALETFDGNTVLILQDLSRVKKEEEQIINLQDRSFGLAQALESLPSGVLITRPQKPGHPIAYCNKALADFVGAAPEDLTGCAIEDILDQFVDEESIAALKEAFRSERQSDVPLTHENEDGSFNYYNISIKPIYSFADQLDLYIGVISDVTELKQQEKMMFQNQKLEALGQLAAGVAHDFNNVLSIIDGYSRILETDLREDEERADKLGKIRSAAQRGANLTRKMLMFSRHQTKSLDVIELCKTVREQKDLLVPLVTAEYKIDIECVDGGDLHIETTYDDILQILMNLVVNARDAMPEGGHIRIGSKVCAQEALPKALRTPESAEKYALLEVADTGTGIDKNTLARIFDPFFTTKGAGRGTGLGLSMVYGLVKQMDGFIDVKTEAGKGTTFQIYLPLTDKEPLKKVRGSPEDLENLSLKGYTVVVAEDEPELLDMVADMLSKLDMTVLKARDGDEALLVQDDYEGEIDLLLTDVYMPGLNGFRLAELMQAERPEIKTVFLSGYPGGEKMEDQNIPSDAIFMVKPVRLEDLAKVVHTLLINQDSDFEVRDGSIMWQKRANN